MPVTKRGPSPSVGVSPLRTAPPVFVAPKRRASVHRVATETPRLKVSLRLTPELFDPQQHPCLEVKLQRVHTPSLCFPGPKFISKSEDNLLTPRCGPSAHQIPWSVETPVGIHLFGAESFSDTPMKMCLKSTFTSEPAMGESKPPAVAALPRTLCCASSVESLESQNCGTDVQNRASPTPTKTSESGCDLQAADPCSSAGAYTAEPSDGITGPTPEGKVLPADTGTPSFLARHRYLSSDPNVTFGQTELAALTPLHIDSAIFEPGPYSRPPGETESASFCAAPMGNTSMEGENEKEAEQVDCSGLIQTLFELGVASSLQSTPYKLGGEDRKGPGGPSQTGPVASAEQPVSEGPPEVASEVQNQSVQAAGVPERTRRVADHIHHFNKLTLRSPRASRLAQLRSPLKFQRTPVHQAVCRINSLSRESRRGTQTPRQVVKAVSLESGLSPHPQLRFPHSAEPEEMPGSAHPIKRPPPIPPRKPGPRSQKLKAGVLGDVTNKVQPKGRTDSSVCSPAAAAAAAQKPVMQLVEKDMNHYRGSPRNPLTHGRLLSATRPVDL